MPWCFTDDVEEFAAHAWDLMASRAVRCTVPLTTVENLRAGVPWSAAPAVLGWYVEEGAKADGGAEDTGAGADDDTGAGADEDTGADCADCAPPTGDEAGAAGARAAGPRAAGAGAADAGPEAGGGAGARSAAPAAAPSVRGAVCWTPPHHLQLGVLPEDGAAALVAELRGRGAVPPGVSGEVDGVARFVAAWTGGGEQPAPSTRMRLYALGALAPPEPAPPGHPRLAGPDDVGTVAGWLSAFAAEAGRPTSGARALAEDRVAGGRILLWEDEEGAAVSMAARQRRAAGVVRVGPVYTPLVCRGRGYGAAVTAACAAEALRAGAADVVLFADLANPTSNAIYTRIGFRPVADFAEVDLPG